MVIPEHLLLDLLRLRRLAADIVDETRTLPQLSEQSIPSIFGDDFDLASEVRKYEIKLIRHALYLANGSQAKATKILGVKASTLNHKIKTYNLHPNAARVSVDGN